MWTNVNLGFGTDEETACFGPRQDVCGTTQSFDTHTLVTISSNEKVQCKPTCTSVATSDYLVLSLDCELFLFDFSCQTLHFRATLDSQIDRIALSEDSQLLLIGERCGKLHIFHVQGQKDLISMDFSSSVNIPQDPTFISLFFTPINKEGCIQAVILLSNSELVIFSNLNMFKLQQGVHEGNLAMLQEVKSDIIQKNISLNSMVSEAFFSPVNACFIPYCQNELLLAIASEELIGVTCMNAEEKFDTEIPSFFSGPVKKLAATYDGRYLFVLDQQCLNLLCSKTFLILNTWELDIEDFILLESVDFQREMVMSTKLAMLVWEASPTGDQIQSLQLRNFPSWELLYSLKLSSFASLVFMPMEQENIFVIERIADEADSGVIASIHIKAISETMPEQRFTKLINKGHFDEAENFARVFGLDMQPVYCARVRSLLDAILPWKRRDLKPSEVDNHIEELQHYLNKIEDLPYVVACVSYASLRTAEETSKFLCTARDRVLMADLDSALKNECLATANRSLQRLTTFQLLHGSDDFGSLWYEFSECNLKKHFFKLLRQNDLNAFLLWERHMVEIGENFTEDDIVFVLDLASDVLCNSDFLQWLKDSFVPFVLGTLPKEVDALIKWLIDQAKMLDITEEANWPEDSLELLRVFPNVCEDLSKMIFKMLYGTDSLVQLHQLQRQANEPGYPIHSLCQLINNLEELLILKKKFSCQLSLSEFTQEDKTDVVFTILDRLPEVQGKNKATDAFLRPYMQKHGLEQDATLLNYVKEVLQKSPCDWWYWEEAPWEERVIEIIDCIQDQDCKISAVVCALSQAPVPWSDAITKLADSVASVNHMSKELIEEHTNLQGLRTVLLKYGLRTFNIKNGRNASLLINHIVRQNKPTAMNDVLLVVKFYKHISDVDAYLIQMQHLLHSGKIDEFNDMLPTIPNEKLKCCILRLTTFVEVSLQDALEWDDQDFRKQAVTLVMGAVNGLSYLEKKEMLSDDARDKLSLLKCVLCLQMEFGIFVSPLSIDSDMNRKELLSVCVTEFLNGKKEINPECGDDRKVDETSKKLSYGKIYRLADVLSLPRECVMPMLVKKFITDGNAKSAESVVSLLTSNVPREETIKTMYEIAQLMYECLHQTVSNKCSLSNLISLSYQLVAFVVTYCNSVDLMKYMDFCHWLELMCYILHAQPPAELQIPENLKGTSSKFTPFHKWKFSSLYQEQGFHVEIKSFLPDVLKCGDILFQRHELSSQDVDDFVKSMRQVINVLRGRGLEAASFRFLTASTWFILNRIHDQTEQESLDISSQLVKTSRISFDLLTVLSVKVLSEKRADYQFVLGLSLLLSPREFLKLLQAFLSQYGTDYHKLMGVTSVAVEYFHLQKNPVSISAYKTLYEKSRWGKKLNDMNIKSVGLFAMQQQGCYALLDELVTTGENINMDAVLDFCTTFELDKDIGLLSYLKALLLSPNLRNCIHLNEDPDVINEMWNNITIQANYILKLIHIKELKIAMLKDLLKTLDPYLYEVVEFVLLHLSDFLFPDVPSFVGKGLKVMQFLKAYKRLNSPSEYEKDAWLSENLECDMLPAVSESRLPFHLLIDSAWKIIEPELTSSSVYVWREIAPLLHLSTDQMQVVAVKNMVFSWLSVHSAPVLRENTPIWDFHPPDKVFLNTLCQLISAITNTEMAAACINWVINRLSPGDLKLLVVQRCLKFAQHWCAEQPSNMTGNEILHRLSNMHHRMAIEQSLHRHGLVTPKVRALVDSPETLIMHLFEEVGNKQLFSVAKNDVHLAVKEIAHVSGCNLQQIYSSMIEKWLLSSQSSGYNEDETCTINFQSFMVSNSVTRKDGGDGDEGDLQRLIHLLQHSPFKENLLCLLPENAATQTARQKARALRCLLAVASDAILQQTMNTTVTQIKTDLKSCLFLSELESQHLPYPPASFEDANKAELISNVLVTCGLDRHALIFSSALCLELELYEQHLWDMILTRMSNLSTLPELKHVLALLNNFPAMWSSTSYIKAWEFLLLSSSSNGHNICMDSTLPSTYMQLIRCPTVSSLHLERIYKELESQKLVLEAFGSILMSHSAHERQILIKNLLKKYPIESLKSDLSKIDLKSYISLFYKQVYSYFKSIEE